MSTPKNTAKSTFINSALLLGAASGFAAHAQEEVKTLEKTKANVTKQDTYKIDKVSNHKISTDLVDTAKTINVVSSEVLADQGITNLNDALRNVSGVSTFGAGEGGGGNVTTNDKITIRGFNANGNIYIDGIRDLAGYSRDLFNTEEVEVIKGASSSISGKGTSGGAVNMVTKRAKQDEFTNVAASYDEAEQMRVSVDTNTSISDITAVRLNALYTSGGDPLGNGVEEYKTTAIAPAIAVEVNDALQFNLDALVMSQRNTPMLGLPYVTSGVAEQLGKTEGAIDSKYWGNYYGVPERDFEDVDVSLATFLLSYQINDHLKLVNQFRAGKNEKKSVVSRPMYHSMRDPETRERTYFDEISLTSVRSLDEKNTLIVNQFDLVGEAFTGSLKHEYVVGWELYKEKKTSQHLSNNIELDTPRVSVENPKTNIGFTGAIEIGGDPSVTEGRGNALYALNNMSLGEHWLFTAGLRYEDYSAEGARYMWKRVDGKWEREYASGLKSEADFISWNTSAGYKPTENSFVYVSAANSQDPAAGDLAFTWSKSAVDQIGALDPQESKNYEFGGKLELMDGELLITTALFNTTKTVTDRDEEGNYFLAGEQEAKGLEFGIEGQITDQLEIKANYTKQDTEVTKDFDEDVQGDGLSAAPENMANIWLTYTLNDWEFSAGANYSSGNTYWRRAKPYFESGSATLLSAMASYQATDNLKLQLNIDNLSDEEYVTDYSARGHFKPGAPRIIKLTANYSF